MLNIVNISVFAANYLLRTFSLLCYKQSAAIWNYANLADYTRVPAKVVTSLNHPLFVKKLFLKFVFVGLTKPRG